MSTSSNTPPVDGTTTATASDIGARSIPEFEGVHDVWPSGERLAAVRAAATEYKKRFKAQGQVLLRE